MDELASLNKDSRVAVMMTLLKELKCKVNEIRDETRSINEKVTMSREQLLLLESRVNSLEYSESTRTRISEAKSFSYYEAAVSCAAGVMLSLLGTGAMKLVTNQSSTGVYPKFSNVEEQIVASKSENELPPTAYTLNVQVNVL